MDINTGLKDLESDFMNEDTQTISSNNNSIFISSNEERPKITYTQIKESMPDCVTERVNGWRKSKKIEFRWRFLEIPERGFTVEISRLPYDEDKRTYLNKEGKWVYRDVSPIYDMYVKEEYYYYAN